MYLAWRAGLSVLGLCRARGSCLSLLNSSPVRLSVLQTLTAGMIQNMMSTDGSRLEQVPRVCLVLRLAPSSPSLARCA